MSNVTYEISFLPRQLELYKEIRYGNHGVIGIHGGRGSGKSQALDRVLISLMQDLQGINLCLIMRTWTQQVVPFHLNQIRKHFPWVDLKSSIPAVLTIGRSTCEFKYAMNYDDCVLATRSGNYDVIFIDQSEQFTLVEIEEIRNACRSTLKTFPKAKLVLSFNMRGSSITEHRKMFLTKEVGDPENYTDICMNPWDNPFWLLKNLEQDGYTLKDYLYGWTEDQRMTYASTAENSYTKDLASKDSVIAKADWFGSWDCIEGAYFANSFDLNSIRLNPSIATQMQKPWANYWIGCDWGKGHYTAVYWNYRIALSPSEADKYLLWKNLTKPINILVTYREMVVNERTNSELGRLISECTPINERALIRAFFLSPENVTDDPNSVGSQMGKELKAHNLPYPVKADNERKGGFTLMDKLFLASKNKGIDLNGVQLEDAWLISSECPQLLAAIPMLQRNPKDLDDVFPADKTSAKIEIDCSDAARYSVKSMLAPKKKTEQDKFNIAMDAATPAERTVLAWAYANKKSKAKKQYLPASWTGNYKK